MCKINSIIGSEQCHKIYSREFKTIRTLLWCIILRSSLDWVERGPRWCGELKKWSRAISGWEWPSSFLVHWYGSKNICQWWCACGCSENWTARAVFNWRSIMQGLNCSSGNVSSHFEKISKRSSWMNGSFTNLAKGIGASQIRSLGSWLLHWIIPMYQRICPMHWAI